MEDKENFDHFLNIRCIVSKDPPPAMDLDLGIYSWYYSYLTTINNKSWMEFYDNLIDTPELAFYLSSFRVPYFSKLHQSVFN